MSRKSGGNVISSECRSYNPLEEGAYSKHPAMSEVRLGLKDEGNQGGGFSGF